VIIKYNQKIKKIDKEKNQFILTTYQGKKHYFDKLIIATGGKSYPITGSTGDGFRFAQNLGHKITPLFPASVPLKVKSYYCTTLQGIKVNATIKIYSENNTIEEQTGEILFTHFGLSAPAVLEASRKVSKYLLDNPESKLNFSINFFPEISL